MNPGDGAQRSSTIGSPGDGAQRSSTIENPREAAEPQAILTPLTEASIFLTLVIEPGGEAAVRDVLGAVSGLRRSVGFRLPEGELTCVVGIGSEAWDRLFDGPRPRRLHPFRELHGAHHAPSTPGDLLVHLRAHRLDMCFELAHLLRNRLRPHARVVDEVHGFRFFDERDLLGFVDGTENPEGAAARTAVLIGEEDPQFACGSYLVTQKYVHDLDGWDALSTEEQENAIGRSKLQDIEMPDDRKPPNSHVALNVVEDENGVEQDILRFNMPFGHVGTDEFGTFFVGYTRDPAVLERMLENMFVGTAEGHHDRILDFSTALTGNLWFVPTTDFLDDPPGT